MAHRNQPIVLEPTSPPDDASKSAALIFVHGLGDDAHGVESPSTPRPPSHTRPLLSLTQILLVSSKPPASFHT